MRSLLNRTMNARETIMQKAREKSAFMLISYAHLNLKKSAEGYESRGEQEQHDD
jgi:hypothetical protein